MTIVGIAAWVVVFACGATLLNTPDTAYWGGFFIAICGFALGIAVSRFPW